MEENRNIKLPVFKVIKAGFILVKTNARPLIKSLLPTGILLFILNIIEIKTYWPAGDAVQLLHLAITGGVFTLFAITCHRTLLLGSQSVPQYGVTSWSAREWRFLWWGMVAYFFLIVLFMLVAIMLSVFTSSVGGPGFGFSGALSLLGIIPGIYVFSRLSILFPAVAIEKKVGWDWALATSKYNGWRLVVIVGLIPLVFGFSPALLCRDTCIVVDVLWAFIGIIFTVFEIALLSLSFKYLSENNVPEPIQAD